jgi:dCMP deaminase
MGICEAVSKHSKCLSRHIGAVIVRDHSIVSTGYNGPARGVPHCAERVFALTDNDPLADEDFVPHGDTCPRRLLGLPSGEGLEYCIAAHAERNCIANAARMGVSTLSCTLYLNTVLPCKDCMAEIINAGITKVICLDGQYDKLSGWMANCAGLKIQRWAP